MTAPVALTMLRAVAPDVPLTVGSILGARVLSREGDRGTLLLLGARLAAQLPEGVKEGDALRVRVQEASAEQARAEGRRDARRAAPRRPGAAHDAAAARAAQRRGRAAVRRARRGRRRRRRVRGSGPNSSSLRYDSPALGRIDIALTLTGDAIGAALQLSAGEPARAARGAIRGAAGRARGGGGRGRRSCRSWPVTRRWTCVPDRAAAPALRRHTARPGWWRPGSGEVARPDRGDGPSGGRRRPRGRGPRRCPRAPAPRGRGAGGALAGGRRGAGLGPAPGRGRRGRLTRRLLGEDRGSGCPGSCGWRSGGGSVLGWGAFDMEGRLSRPVRRRQAQWTC